MTNTLHTVLVTSAFTAQALKIMSDDEISTVIDQVAREPLGGDLIKGAGGLRKMRIPLQGRGTRGGARVIYWFHSELYPVALLYVFAKNQAANLTAAQAATLARIGASIIADIGVK